MTQYSDDADDDYDPRIVDETGAIKDADLPMVLDAGREAAHLLGRRGGRANTPAQRAQRAAAKPGAGRPPRDPYGCRYHRDGTVTYWSVYEQQWRRVGAAAISDEALATMTATERDRIARHAERAR